MAHIGSSSESSSSDVEASSYVQQQTGSKRAGQVLGPKAAAKKAKKQQIFVDSWLQDSAFKTWLCKKVGSDGKSKPWCKTCDKDLNCSKTGLNRHLKSKSHEKNQASTSFTGNVDDIWKRVASNNNDRAKSMEIKICAFLAEHNLPISLSDGLVQFLQSLFPRDDVIKTVTLGKQKASNVIRQVLGFNYLHQAASTLRSEKFSFIIDEATDLSTSKQLAILATYFDMDAFETKHYLVEMVEVEAGTAEAIIGYSSDTTGEHYWLLVRYYQRDVWRKKFGFPAVKVGAKECANSEMLVPLNPFSFFLRRKNVAKEFRRIMSGHICTLPPFIKKTRCLQAIPKFL